MTIGINNNYQSGYTPQNNQNINQNNQETGIFTLDGNNVLAMADEEVETLLSEIKSGKEDKAMATYEKLLSHYAALFGENIETADSVTKDLLKFELEKYIENKLNEDKKEEDFIELEDYIKSNCADATEQYWQETYYSDDKVDNYTEEDLLNVICGENVEKNVSGLNKTGAFFMNLITFGFGTEVWNDFWGNEPR